MKVRLSCFYDPVQYLSPAVFAVNQGVLTLRIFFSFGH